LKEIDMTLDDLKHLFRLQTMADENFTPTDRLEYILYEGKTKLTLNVDKDKLADILPTLDNFEFEGYKDRSPYFVKPDLNLG